MKQTMYTIPLFAIALALAASDATAADAPSKSAPAAVDAAAVKADAEQSRRELDQMREQMRELSKKMAQMSAKLGDVGPRAYAYRYLGDPDRGLIGVVLSKDEHGTRITAVTPGGPADQAGIKNGDMLVSVRGADLQTPAGDSAKNLSEALRNLKAGQEVTLSLLRDDKKIEVKVKAERREPYDANYAINGSLAFKVPDTEQVRVQVEQALEEANLNKQQVEQLREQSREIARQATDQARMVSDQARQALKRVNFSMPWWGLNLASLNSDLGSYFGTDHGVLVLSADVDASKTLKSGDVLLAINGKKVERPEDALRQLRENNAGNEVKVEVLRQHKTQTLSMKAPEFKNMFVPAPPAPPMAPLAPIAPIGPIAPMAPMAPMAPLERIAPIAPPAPPPPPAPPNSGSDT
jgi:C-terminal processing protease CtpA/Prc